MIYSSARYSGPKEIKYLFIDGGYLDKIIEKAQNVFFGVALDIDYKKIGEGFDKVFYYNCLPGKKNGESANAYEERIYARKLFY